MQAENTPDGPVKIGYTSRRVRRRLSEAQTYAHQKLAILADVSGTLDDEAKLHRLFKDYLVRGEWYRYEGIVRELILHITLDEGSFRSWVDGQDIPPVPGRGSPPLRDT